MIAGVREDTFDREDSGDEGGDYRVKAPKRKKTKGSQMTRGEDSKV